MFTTKDRLVFNSMSRMIDQINKWKTTVDPSIIRIKAIEGTGLNAMSKANQALSGATSAATTGLNAMKEIDQLRQTMNDLSSSINSTMKHTDQALATAAEAKLTAENSKSLAQNPPMDTQKIKDYIDGMNISKYIKNLQDDMDAIKLSVLVQTCSDLGTQNGDLRMYTAEECDAMNGVYSTDGKCNKKEGGSFSYDCGKLYKNNPSSTAAITQVVQPPVVYNNVGGPPPAPAPTLVAQPLQPIATTGTTGTTSSTGNQTWPAGRPYYGEYSLEELMDDPLENALIIALRLGLGTPGVKAGFSIQAGSTYNAQELAAADKAFLDALAAKRSPTEAAYAAAAAASKLRANSRAATTVGGSKKRTRRRKYRRSGTRRHRK